MENARTVTMKGNPLALEGPELKPGMPAPAFTLLDQDLNPVTLADFKGKLKIISVTPSLDTPVCDLQAKRFNAEAEKLAAQAVIINVSMDLPFAIRRFCAAEGVTKIKVLSDHRDASFGTAYGVLIRELRLLARAVFIIGTDDTIQYAQIVPELTNPPDFESVLKVLKG
jgi:thiol peroxidase